MAGAIAQLACLLFDLTSTLLWSALLSIKLWFSILWRREPSHRGAQLYQGRVWHERRKPTLHGFKYDVRYALVDLDNIPEWFQRSASSHLSAAAARSITGTNGPVRLLTIPTSVGYEQNPLSVYYCYEKLDNLEPRLVKCIAEVTNTPWAERVTFAFEPGLDMVPKPLHVSPFMDMLGTWRMKVSEPRDELQLVIDVQHPELGNYFSAGLKAKRVEHSNAEAFFWLMPHKVALWIYWHAVLLVLKGVSFITHPKYSATGVFYRVHALNRDKEFRSQKFPGSEERYCSWRDAKSWPWI